MSLRIYEDDQLLHQQDVVTPASEVDSRTIPAFQDLLKRPGSHELTIKATSLWSPQSTEFESFFELSYLVKLPPSHGNFTVSWSETGRIMVNEGDYIRRDFCVSNKGRDLGMVTAVVGNGLECQVDRNPRGSIRPARRNEEITGRGRDFLFRDERAEPAALLGAFR